MPITVPNQSPPEQPLASTPAPQPDQHPLSVLIVFPWFLDEMGHGNIQRVRGYARYLSRHGVAVDLVYQAHRALPSREAELEGFRRILRVERTKSSDDANLERARRKFYRSARITPASLKASGALTVAVRGLLEATEYTAVISTYAWTAPIFEPLDRTGLRICDTQDVMHLHGQRSVKATGRSTGFSLEEETERYLWRKWDVLLAITPEEATIMSNGLRPKQRILTVGHAVQLSAAAMPATRPRIALVDESAPAPAATLVVVYTGSDNPSNQRAMEWLLLNVWPRVVDACPTARLRVVGRIAELFRHSDPAGTPNLDLVGYVDNPLEEVANADVVVAPYLYGSGLKIKVLEAAAAGRAIVTTSSGLEGTGMTAGVHLLVADDAEAFTTTLVGVLKNEQLRLHLGDAAREHVGQMFSEEACYGELLDLLTSSAAGDASAIPFPVRQRLRAVRAFLPKARIVVWGNGAHTRALMPILEKPGMRIRCIVDKSATVPSLSAEDVPVVPATSYQHVDGDLIILSSELFEQAMWDDVAPLRGRGAHVMALYRPDLVTEAVANGLEPRAPIAATSMRAPRTPRLIVAAPSAGRAGGPVMRMARALREAADSHIEIVVAGALRPDVHGIEKRDESIFERTFEFAPWDCMVESRPHLWEQLSRYARSLAQDLETLSKRLQIGRGDTVLFQTANLVEMLAASYWLGTITREEIPAVRLLFQFTAEEEAQWWNTQADRVSHAYAMVAGLLRERAGGRLKLLAQTDTLAQTLTRVIGHRVDEMGFPVTRRLLGGCRVEATGPVRLMYASEPPAEEGLGLLSAVARELRHELESGGLTLVCQGSPSGAAADDISKGPAEMLRNQHGVELVDSFVYSRHHDKLVASCDLMLLPYDAQRHQQRRPPVFVDATCAGVLPIVPADTWMSRQLDAGLGVGIAFDELTPERIAAGVRTAIKDLPALKRRARQATRRVWDHNDPEHVLAAILGPQRST